MTLLPERKWCVMDLVTDHASGKLRESSVWSNVGKAVVTWMYVEHVSADNFETMTLVLVGAVIGHEIVSRLTNAKQQASQEVKP